MQCLALTGRQVNFVSGSNDHLHLVLGRRFGAGRSAILLQSTRLIMLELPRNRLWRPRSVACMTMRATNHMLLSVPTRLQHHGTTARSWDTIERGSHGQAPCYPACNWSAARGPRCTGYDRTNFVEEQHPQSEGQETFSLQCTPG